MSLCVAGKQGNGMIQHKGRTNQLKEESLWRVDIGLLETWVINGVISLGIILATVLSSYLIPSSTLNSYNVRNTSSDLSN